MKGWPWGRPPGNIPGGGWNPGAQVGGPVGVKGGPPVLVMTGTEPAHCMTRYAWLHILWSSMCPNMCVTSHIHEISHDRAAGRNGGHGMLSCRVHSAYDSCGNISYQHTSQAFKPLWLEGRPRQVLASSDALLMNDRPTSDRAVWIAPGRGVSNTDKLRLLTKYP